MFNKTPKQIFILAKHRTKTPSCKCKNEASSQVSKICDCNNQNDAHRPIGLQSVRAFSSSNQEEVVGTPSKFDSGEGGFLFDVRPTT